VSGKVVVTRGELAPLRAAIADALAAVEEMLDKPD
jgi:hypothetical protein